MRASEKLIAKFDFGIVRLIRGATTRAKPSTKRKPELSCCVWIVATAKRRHAEPRATTIAFERFDTRVLGIVGYQLPTGKIKQARLAYVKRSQTQFNTTGACGASPFNLCSVYEVTMCVLYT